MNKKEFYRYIEQGEIQGACRYHEYWFVYKNLPKKGRALDLGSGKGMIPSLMKKVGLETYSTEANQERVSFQRSKGIDCRLVKNEILPFNNDFFDVITAVSSIEHFDDDLLMMKEVLRTLKKGGLFILIIPAGDKMLKNKFAEVPKHPKEKIYNEAEYGKVFLNGFREIKRKLYKPTNKYPTDFTPHKKWGHKINFEETDKLARDVVFCAVLKK